MGEDARDAASASSIVQQNMFRSLRGGWECEKRLIPNPLRVSPISLSSTVDIADIFWTEAVVDVRRFVPRRPSISSRRTKRFQRRWEPLSLQRDMTSIPGKDWANMDTVKFRM